MTGGVSWTISTVE